MSYSLGWSPSIDFIPNSLQSILSEGQRSNFTFVTVPIQVKSCRPLSNLTDLSALKEWQSSLLASSDRALLNSNDWSNRILFKIDLKDENCHLLFDYAAHLTVFAVLIENDDWTVEEVASLLDLHKAKSFPFKIYLKCQFFDWIKWNNLMNFLEDSNLKNLIGVIPELRGVPEALESNEFCYKIWQCEMLKGIIIDEGVFVRNAKGYPVLPRLVQNYLRSLFKTIGDCPIILSTCRSVSSDCAAYVKWFLDPERRENQLNEIEMRTKSFVEGFENVLQTPLQPLHDHLPSETYEIFERDPVKYQLYEAAIESALKDKKGSGEQEVVQIGVFGAGRGPLVQAALNAAEKASCRVKVVALEKSPNACLTLLDRFKAFPEVEIFYGDMRHSTNQIHESSFDLIVSELLGSFGDNELSPECLWPVESLLKPSGTFIPQSYTSFLEPCYAPILRTQVKELQGVLEGNSFDYGYVVQATKAFKMCASPSPVFTFKHPRDENETGIRNIKLSFTSLSPQVPIDGLIGYFDCQLYREVRMSTVPSRASPGMLSWFPIYFPLKTAASGDHMEIEFKRRKDSQKVWYEWKMDSNEEFQNSNGNSYSIFI